MTGLESWWLQLMPKAVSEFQQVLGGCTAWGDEVLVAGVAGPTEP